MANDRSTRFQEPFCGKLCGLGQICSRRGDGLTEIAQTTWFQAHGGSGNSQARKVSFPRMWEDFDVWLWPFGSWAFKSLLGSLANLPGSAASAPATEEKRKSSSCALLWGRTLTWIFSWVLTLPCAPGIPREHVWPRFVGLVLIWVSLYLSGTCSAFFEYHGFLVPACFYVNCLGWETSEGWVYRKKKWSQVTSFQHAFHRGNESSLCRKQLLTTKRWKLI